MLIGLLDSVDLVQGDRFQNWSHEGLLTETLTFRALSVHLPYAGFRYTFFVDRQDSQSMPRAYEKIRI